MNSVQSIDHFPAVEGSKSRRHALYAWVSNALKTGITRGDIGNSGRQQKCGNCLTARSLSRTGYVQSVTKSLRITTTLCQTTEIRRVWEERGETTIRTIFKQHTGGAMKRKDRPEWTDGRSFG